MTTPAAARTDADNNRFYPIPDPTTGEVIDLPNISSVLNVLWSPGLAEWRTRQAIVGATSSDDMIARTVAAAHTPLTGNSSPGRDRNRALDTVIEDAIARGQLADPTKGFLANDFGSAIHLLTEHLDRAPIDITMLPSSVADHAANYLHMMSGHGLEVVHSEFTVFHHAHRYAGTGDRIIRFTPNSPHLQVPPEFEPHDLGRGCFIADIKTGAVKEKAAMQLAALVNAEGIYDAETQTIEALPADLRRDIGFTIHLTNRGCALIPMQLDTAWPAFKGAILVKTFCDSKPMLPELKIPAAGPLAAGVDAAPAVSAEGTAERTAAVPSTIATSPAPEGATVADTAAPSEPVHISAALDATLGAAIAAADPFAGINGEPIEDLATKKRDWLIGRIRNLSEVGREHLAANWPAGIPTFTADPPPTLDQMAVIDRACWDAEKAVRAPFPDPDPTDEVHVGHDDPRPGLLLERAKALPIDLVAEFTARYATIGCPHNLSRRPHSFLPSHLDAIDALLAEFEPEAAERAQKVADAMTLMLDKDITDDTVLVALGCATYLHIDSVKARALDDLVDAVYADIVGPNSDGTLAVLMPAMVLDAYGKKKRELTGYAKAAANELGRELPATCDAALADPVLAAVLYMAADQMANRAPAEPETTADSASSAA